MMRGQIPDKVFAAVCGGVSCGGVAANARSPDVWRATIMDAVWNPAHGYRVSTNGRGIYSLRY